MHDELFQVVIEAYPDDTTEAVLWAEAARNPLALRGAVLRELKDSCYDPDTVMVSAIAAARANRELAVNA